MNNNLVKAFETLGRSIEQVIDAIDPDLNSEGGTLTTEQAKARIKLITARDGVRRAIEFANEAAREMERR